MADKPITSDGGMIAARVPLKDAIWRAAYPNGRAELLSVSNEEAAAREHIWSLAIAQIVERLWKKRRVLEFFQVVRQWDESWPKKPTFEAAEKAVNLYVARHDELHNEIIPHLDAVAQELQSACEDGEVLLWWKGERIDPRELSQFKITRYWRRTSGRTVVDFRLEDSSFSGQDRIVGIRDQDGIVRRKVLQSAFREGVKVYEAPLEAWMAAAGRLQAGADLANTANELGDEKSNTKHRSTDNTDAVLAQKLTTLRGIVRKRYGLDTKSRSKWPSLREMAKTIKADPDAPPFGHDAIRLIIGGTYLPAKRLAQKGGTEDWWTAPDRSSKSG